MSPNIRLEKAHRRATGKHLFEFTQVEGIVVDPNANFAQLLGYLKEFFKKMGYSDVRNVIAGPKHNPVCVKFILFEATGYIKPTFFAGYQCRVV